MTVVSNSIDRFVGMRLRLQRERLRLSRRQFAGALEIAENELCDYENGAVRVSARLLQKIAERLNVAPSYFFKGMTVVPAATLTEERGPASPEPPEWMQDAEHRIGEGLEGAK